MSREAKPVLAAGCVVWRELDGEILLLLVHRGKYRDVSLPKGKLDQGELMPAAAVREVEEETGIRVRLGTPLGRTVYVQPSGRHKLVDYWAAEATESAVHASTFVPNKEIAGIEWVSVGKARKRLSYPADVEIIDAFDAIRRRGALRTFPLVVLRHGKAVSPGEWDGPDATRPLQERGMKQSERIVGALRAFGVRRIVASTAVRCQQTVAPLSLAIDQAIKACEPISQDAWEDGMLGVREVVGKRIRSGRGAVLCSHGPVIPEIVREVALATGTVVDDRLRRASVLDTAMFTVLHVSRSNPGSGIVGIETHSPRP